MIKIRNQNSTQSTNEPVKKTINQAKVNEDLDDEQGSDLLNIKKKEKNQNTQKTTKNQAESVWQQNGDNNIKQNVQTPKVVEPKKMLNLGVTKGEQAQAIVAEEADFPDFEQMMSQPQKKKATIQAPVQVLKEQAITPSTSGGKSSFQNSKKGTETTPFVVTPVQQQIQQPQQPLVQLNVNSGPVSFKHTNKDDKKTVLDQPIPLNIKPIQPAEVYVEPAQIIQRQLIVQGQQEVVPPKQIKFQNSNPVQVNQNILVPQAPKDTTIETNEEAKKATITFKTPSSFLNTSKKDQTQVTVTKELQIHQEKISQPQQNSDTIQKEKVLQKQNPVSQQDVGQIYEHSTTNKSVENAKQESFDEWEEVQPKIKHNKNKK